VQVVPQHLPLRNIFRDLMDKIQVLVVLLHMVAALEQDIQIRQQVLEQAGKLEHMLITGFEAARVAEVAAQKDNGVAKVNQIMAQHHS
jgi:hypothetical protein